MPSSALQEMWRDDVVRLRPARRSGQGQSARRPVVPRTPEGHIEWGWLVLVVATDGARMSARLVEETAPRAVNIDRGVLALAGTMTLVSVVLVALMSPWWLLLTGFVGLNLLQSSLTGFCPAAIVLRRLGVPGGCAFR